MGELDPELRELETRLRAAQSSLEPRPGLRREIRTRLRRTRPAWTWPALGSAAAVLLAVAGVGVLLGRQSVLGPESAAGPVQKAVAPDLGFGRLPPLVTPTAGSFAEAGSGSGAAGAPAPTAGASADHVPAGPPPGPAPASVPVYRWTASRTAPSCHPSTPPTLDGYPVVGAVGCLLEQPLSSSVYRLLPAPSGARLVYVPVSAGAVGYFEPAYLLSDGSLTTALTPEEMAG